ncbi:hypothetical protein KRIGEM_03348 [Komagataeibacter rhaeticus]|nr:hypothetical protein KRIGEM_03348 [Komagataeibacter rhaeticus]
MSKHFSTAAHPRHGRGQAWPAPPLPVGRVPALPEKKAAYQTSRLPPQNSVCPS